MEVGFDSLLNDSNSFSQKCIFLENQLFNIKKKKREITNLE
jgi:hypothetical protein